MVLHFPFLFRPISLIMNRYLPPQGNEMLSKLDGNGLASDNIMFEVDVILSFTKIRNNSNYPGRRFA